MVQPVATVTLGGTDISTYVSNEGTPVTWGRGASFDGQQESPGHMAVVVQNPDRRFNPLNSSSPIIAQLKFGKKLRLTCTHSAVTYYLFEGYLRSIFQRDDGFAELHCQDALYNFAQKETYISGSFGRTMNSFRSAILSDIAYSGSSLATNGGESMTGYTGADAANVLSLLTELNRATGTIHYMNPTSGGADYTTIDRTTFQTAASSEDWVDTDLSTPFATDLGSTVYSDERLVNSQRVQARPREKQSEIEIWRKPRWTVNASSSETRWANFNDPVIGTPTASYTTISGSPTVTVTAYGRTAKVVVAAGGTAVDLKNVVLRGYPATEVEVGSAKFEDATSISTYGRYEGGEIASDYLPSEAHANGLGSYIVWRNKDASLVPGPTFVNRFPTQLARDVGDVVRITSTELGPTTLGRFVIRGFESSIVGKGDQWTTRYTLEALPAALDLFTIGGTAGQGVGGTGVLAY